MRVSCRQPVKEDGYMLDIKRPYGGFGGHAEGVSFRSGLPARSGMAWSSCTPEWSFSGLDVTSRAVLTSRADQ